MENGELRMEKQRSALANCPTKSAEPADRRSESVWGFPERKQKTLKTMIVLLYVKKIITFAPEFVTKQAMNHFYFTYSFYYFYFSKE